MYACMYDVCTLYVVAQPGDDLKKKSCSWKAAKGYTCPGSERPEDRPVSQAGWALFLRQMPHVGA